MNVKRMFTLGDIRPCAMASTWLKKNSPTNRVMFENISSKATSYHLRFIIVKTDVWGCTYTPQKAIKKRKYIFTKYNKTHINSVFAELYKNPNVPGRVVFFYRISCLVLKGSFPDPVGFPFCQHWATSTRHD